MDISDLSYRVIKVLFLLVRLLYIRLNPLAIYSEETTADTFDLSHLNLPLPGTQLIYTHIYT